MREGLRAAVPTATVGKREGREAVMQRFLRDVRLLDALDSAVIATDLEGTVLFWNRAAERLYGWTAAEATGRAIFEVAPAVASRERGQEMCDAVRTRTPWSGDFSTQRRDGSTFLAHGGLSPIFDDEDRYVGTLAVSADVTETRLLETQVRDRGQRLQLALEAGRLGTWHSDRVTGLVSWDARMEALFGLEPGSFPGTVDAWLARTHPGDRDRLVEALENCDPDGPFTIRHRIVWPDGSLHRIEGRGQLVVDADGQVTGTIGCAHETAPAGRTAAPAPTVPSQGRAED